MFGKGSRSDPAAPSRARDYAHWLVRDHGDEAEAVLAEKLKRRNASAAMMQVYRLARGELRKLRRQQAESRNALVVLKPPLLDRLADFLGIARKQSRRRGRRKR